MNGKHKLHWKHRKQQLCKWGLDFINQSNCFYCLFSDRGIARGLPGPPGPPGPAGPSGGSSSGYATATIDYTALMRSKLFDFFINRSFYCCNNGETLSLTLHLPRIFLFLDPEFRSWMSSSVKQGAPGPAGSPGLPGPPGPQGPPGVSSATVYGSGGRGHSLEEIQRYLQGESDGEKEDHVCYLVLNQVKNDPCTYRKHISLMATCRFIWWKV